MASFNFRFFSMLLVFACISFTPQCYADALHELGLQNSKIPLERFIISGSLIEKFGDHGTPVILIPGLAAGPWAWGDLINRISLDHVTYSVTFPGFDGLASSAEKDKISPSIQSIMSLIENRKLIKPILIGHSLGATISIRIAEDYPEAIGALIAIDGLPIFPGLELVSPLERNILVDNVEAKMVGLSSRQFYAQQAAYMRDIGVTDPKAAIEIAKLSAKSDPNAVAYFMADDLRMDLRPKLSSIISPVLLIVPFSPNDGLDSSISKQEKVSYYANLMHDVRDLQVSPIAPSRHYVMFDQPRLLIDSIEKFILKISSR